VLWKKVMPKLSAGRVQSVATRMVVDRERERIAFRTASYWDLDATLDAGEGKQPRQFGSRLVSVDGRRVAQGRDFAPTGELRTAGTVHLDEAAATALASALRDSSFRVRSIDSKPYTRKPYAPFRTTTLQQEANRKLNMSASQTMQIAQRLYENGNITYMRTDSVTLSDTAISAARSQVRELYGASYLPDKPRIYTSKVKNAQEAHEAIRPAGEVFQTPAQTGLNGAEYRLYELIWMRTIASQMKDAEGRSVSIRIDARASSGQNCEFTSSGRVITFHGFLKAYVEGADDPSADTDDRETRLPDVAEGDVVPAVEVLASGHETKPPARFTEATLIRELEEREIGRPSTYASILGTIQARGYVYKKGNALVPAWLAFAVVRLLEEHFTRLIDYAFTATMEDVLDEVAAGNQQREGVLGRFYFGDDGIEGLQSMVGDLGEIDAREMSTFPIRDDGDAGMGGDGIVVRVGRYGPYVEDKDENRANVPEDLPPDELTVAKARELLSQPSGVELELGNHPESGHKVVAKAGRFGPYVTELLPEDAPKGAKPRTGSLLKSMSLDSITLDDAVRLLSLPRVVGKDPESGEEITAQNGRYGPYLKKGTDSRSLETEEQMFDITLEEALKIYAQPKQRGRRAAAPPLKELGEDPESGKPVVVKEGRFGPYVTDGETNATLRKDDSIDSISLLRAAELLADKRARGPVKKKATAKTAAPAKKATAKKAPAKKATAAKKATGKKTAAAGKTAANKS
jgi:DNA topoisomerase-1